MIQRCTNPNRAQYADYGGRGIRVCDRWRKFANFAEDMGQRPAGMTLDRIEVDGDYSRGNCRWASPEVQAQGRRASMASLAAAY
jgi:hypothetical protein